MVDSVKRDREVERWKRLSASTYNNVWEHSLLRLTLNLFSAFRSQTKRP